MLTKYTNNNYTVKIFEDGTKIRSGKVEFSPIFPESIDLKITNWCNLGCKYCHEKSNTKGKHSLFKDFEGFVKCLPNCGIELAIGGGDPLSHSDIFRFFKCGKFYNKILNLTVNSCHLKKHSTKIEKLRQSKQLIGLGISYNKNNLEDIERVCDSNTVIHVIAGVTPLEEIKNIKNKKVLILGYKKYGFGSSFYSSDIQQNIDELTYWIGTLIKNTNNHYSFDNLAIKQLGIRRLFSDKQWDNFYMGDDGNFTMYVDLVNMEYAKSSISNRLPITNFNIEKMFENIK